MTAEFRIFHEISETNFDSMVHDSTSFFLFKYSEQDFRLSTVENRRKDSQNIIFDLIILGIITGPFLEWKEVWKGSLSFEILSLKTFEII